MGVLHPNSQYITSRTWQRSYLVQHVQSMNGNIKRDGHRNTYQWVGRYPGCHVPKTLDVVHNIRSKTYPHISQNSWYFDVVSTYPTTSWLPHKAPNLTLQGYLTGQLGRHWYPPMYPLDETNISYSHLKNRMAQMQYQSIFFGGIGRGVLLDLVRSRPRGAEGTPPSSSLLFH